MYDNASNLDKFTGKNISNIGNKQLTYPIALMSVDEVAYAGGIWGSRSEKTYYYLNSKGASITNNKTWWTMSPSIFNGTDIVIFDVEIENEPSVIGHTRGKILEAIRPVLSLKSCVEISGDGTVKEPYEVLEISDECALADN